MAMQTWPLPSEYIHFVDSVNSEEFSLFLLALERASVVAMDAEWKPVPSYNRRTFPRVALMQLACRLVSDNEITDFSMDSDHSSSTEEEVDGETSQNDDMVSVEDGTESMHYAHRAEFIECTDVNKNEESISELRHDAQGSTIYANHINRAAAVISAEPQTLGLILKEGKKCLELSLSGLKEKQEMIFLLDMMSLPVISFWEAMKRMLVSPTILKLGFKFKQDLVNLAKSFPGPDAHCCFDKVDPYVDIGKLFAKLYGWNGNCSDRVSLATICEQVVGYTLCKDLQCSNWEQRPLTIEQQVYAATDAHCLLVACDVLRSTLKGQEHSLDCTTTSTKDGIGVLLSDPMGPYGYTSCNVQHAPRGVAITMVRAAAFSGMVATAGLNTVNAFPSGAAHMVFVQKFGERLLLSEEMIKKAPKKKSKSGDAKRKLQSAVEGFLGPPPWDPSCGGDGTVKFLCDDMVEGLAKRLRNVGFDTVNMSTKKSNPRKMVELAEKEGRVFLTQDWKFLHRRLFPPNLAYYVKSSGKQEQLNEVVNIFNLEILEESLLSRCGKCNGEFFPNVLTPEEAVAGATGGQTFPEYALKTPVMFWQCSQCRHIYWQGKQFYRSLDALKAFAQKVKHQRSQYYSEEPKPGTREIP